MEIILFAMSESKPYPNIYLENSIVEMKHKDGRKQPTTLEFIRPPSIFLS